MAQNSISSSKKNETDITEEMKQLFVNAYNETGKNMLKHIEADLKDGIITITKS